MKATFTRLPALILALLLAFAPAAAARAEEAGRDGLFAELRTDRDTFAAGEPIHAVLTVRGTGPRAVGDLSLRVLPPEGYAPEAGSPAVLDVGTLAPGETALLDVRLVPAPGASLLWLWLLIGALAAAGAGFAYFRFGKSRGKGVKAAAALVLCAALLAAAPARAADGADRQAGLLRLTRRVLVGGAELTVAAEVRYTPPDAESGTGLSLCTAERMLVNDGSALTVWLEADGPAETVTLMYGEENGPRSGVPMHDDGRNADDIAGDGIWTARVHPALSTDTVLHLTAVSGDRVSNEVTVPCLNPISASTLDAIDVAGWDIRTLITDAGFRELPEDERLRRVLGMLSEWEESGLIARGSVHEDRANRVVSFRWPEGILGGVSYGDSVPDANEDGLPAPVQAESALPPADGGIGSALILNSFPAFEENESDIRKRTVFYENLRMSWNLKGLATTLLVNPSIDDYLTMGQYQIVCISTHGEFFTWRDEAGQERSAPVIKLPEISSPNMNTAWQAELRLGQIAIVDNEYLLLPAFFADHFDAGSLSDTFIFSECCEALGKDHGADRSRYDFSMADTFIRLGARNYVGFHNSVNLYYCRELMSAYVGALITGSTAGDAYAAALEDVGTDYGDYYRRQTAHDTSVLAKPDWGIGYPAFRGTTDAALVRGLRNPGFEEYGARMAMPGYWTSLGDVRTLPRLGDITPAEGGRMAALSTGIGSRRGVNAGDGTESSLMTQTFRVPDDATKLCFDYCFVSEEPMEYIGRKYNDECILLLSGGGNAYRGVFASVNNSSWMPAEGIDFPGGDGTACKTGWKTAEIDVTNRRGQAVTLGFMIRDVGDSLFGSVCLIDRIRIE
ncbi:MAG: hypothetical protein IKP10_00010 [Clostridia bacterium]|nr:hypothetical protein [Clostridia bacterium]